MGSILEDLALKLSDVVGIKVHFPLPEDKSLVMKIHARLFLLYDDDWALDTASLSCKKIQRLLNVVGLGHLCPKPADVTDPRRLPRVWSAFVSKIEEKYGSSGLYPRLRKVLKKQQILEARREADRARNHGPPADANPTRPPPPRQEASFSSQESDTGFRFPRPVARGRHISSSSTVSSTASQSPSKPRSKIPILTKPNVIPTGRQLTRSPCGPKPAATPPSPGPGSPPVPAQRLCVPASATKPATAPPQGRTPASVRKPQSKRLSQLVVDGPRRSSSGISYQLVAVAPVRRSVDDSPVKPADSPVDAGVAPSPLSKAASPDRRKSLVPVAVSPEQILGRYIEDQLSSRFPDHHQQNEAQGELVLPPQEKGAKDSRLDATFTPEKDVPTESRGLKTFGNEENELPEFSEKKEESVSAGSDVGVRRSAESVEENGVESESKSHRRSTFEVVPASGMSPALESEDAPVMSSGVAAGKAVESVEYAPAPVDPSVTPASEVSAPEATTVEVKPAPKEDTAEPDDDSSSQTKSVKAEVAVKKAPAKRRGSAKKSSAAAATLDMAAPSERKQSPRAMQSCEIPDQVMDNTSHVQNTPDVSHDSEAEPDKVEATAVRRRPARGRKQREPAVCDAVVDDAPAGGMALRLRSELSRDSRDGEGAAPTRPRRAAAKKATEALHAAESPLPEPRQRRLRVVHDSDSTPPEPSPPRRAAKPSARSRRTLRAVENCD